MPAVDTLPFNAVVTHVVLLAACGRRGLTVEDACATISREMLDVFNYALVWGRCVLPLLLS
jgi:hypothetical protein